MKLDFFFFTFLLSALLELIRYRGKFRCDTRIFGIVGSFVSLIPTQARRFSSTSIPNTLDHLTHESIVYILSIGVD